MTTAAQSDVDLGPGRQIVEQWGELSEDDLIPLLQRLQRAYGYLPPAVLKWVGRQTGLPVTRMYSVATFYSQFHLEPRGRHTIRVCRGTACHVRGGKKVAAAVRRHVGVSEGETTDDMRFTFETVACLGTCFLAPVMMIDDTYYGRVAPDRVGEILDSYD